MAEVEYAVGDGVGRLRLNRPERKNALTVEMIDEIVAIVQGARTDEQVRVVLLSAAGDAFCSGVDLSMLQPGEHGLSASPLEIKRILTEHIHRIAYAMEDVGKPVVAAVNGSAVGAGMDLSLMCDMRIAGRSARFAEGYIRVGLVPGAGGCHFLPRVVGRAKALELLLTGDFVNAEEAQAIGLVNRVVDDAQLDAEVDAFAGRIAAASPVAASIIRRATHQAERCDLRTSLDMISSHLAVVSATADVSEALTAMRERRDPVFSGE